VVEYRRVKVQVPGKKKECESGGDERSSLREGSQSFDAGQTSSVNSPVEATTKVTTPTARSDRIQDLRDEKNPDRLPDVIGRGPRGKKFPLLRGDPSHPCQIYSIRERWE